jgi:hypothetical protein
MSESDSSPEKRLVLGGLAGLAAALAGAVIWAVVTVSTKHQIGWMAVGVGALVGFALRVGNGGKAFGILGAFLALFGCLFGNYLSIIAFAAAQEHVGFLAMLNTADTSKVINLMWDDFLSASILFYAIAVYEGYRFSVVPKQSSRKGAAPKT